MSAAVLIRESHLCDCGELNVTIEGPTEDAPGRCESCDMKLLRRHNLGPGETRRILIFRNRENRRNRRA